MLERMKAERLMLRISFAEEVAVVFNSFCKNEQSLETSLTDLRRHPINRRMYPPGPIHGEVQPAFLYLTNGKYGLSGGPR
jgi:hypothetical protein